MAAVAPNTSNSSDSSDDSESEEWGWDAIKNWWNPSCNKGCQKAEKKLCKAFVNDKYYIYESKQVLINYDPTPISIKQKQALKSSKTTFTLFNFNKDKDKDNKIKSKSKSMSTSALPTYNKTKTKNDLNKPLHSNTNKNCNNKPVKQEYIHTLTFRIKPNMLQSLINKVKQDQINKQQDINNNDDNSDNSDDDYDDDLANDGKHIDGKSMDKYYERKKKQQGSSTYLTLQKQIETYVVNNTNDNNNKSVSLPPIVLTHGYGCAGGIFIPSITNIFETILANITVSESPVIHLIDYLGHGMSSRPEFQCTNTKEAEDWFVESLEEWRISMNIDKFILSGHSLGGYTSAVYAIRYPQCVDHLILISPVGLPERPKDADKTLDSYSWKVRTMFKTFRSLWNSGWTPHDIIRITGPKGKDLIKKLVKRRLFRIDDSNPLKTLLAEYLYHVIAQTGSGEYALNKILAPGAYAHNPLCNRLGDLKQFQQNVNGYDGDYHDNDYINNQLITTTVDNDDMVVIQSSNGLNNDNNSNVNDDNDQKYVNDDNDIDDNDDNDIDVMNVLNSRLKIDFIYGETDWMTSGHAVKLKDNGVIKCDVYINPDCGHQLCLENATGFGDLYGAVIAKGHIVNPMK